MSAGTCTCVNTPGTSSVGFFAEQPEPHAPAPAIPRRPTASALDPNLLIRSPPSEANAAGGAHVRDAGIEGARVRALVRGLEDEVSGDDAPGHHEKRPDAPRDPARAHLAVQGHVHVARLIVGHE